MNDPRIAELQVIVTSYLDGVESFDAAARRLALILRHHPPASNAPSEPPGVPSLKPFSLKSIPKIRVADLDLAPGRPAVDQAKALAVFARAIRLAPTIQGEAV